MTNIDKIREAREAFDTAYEEIHNRTWKQRLQSRITVTTLHEAALRVMHLQDQAIVQATEVADENFDRAQKLTDQVQENVKHIEALAERRGEDFERMVSALDDLLELYRHDEGCEQLPQYLAGVKALAMAKGEVA